MYHQFQIARLEFFYAASEDHPAVVYEHEVCEYVLDLFHLMCRDDDGAAAIEIVVQSLSPDISGCGGSTVARPCQCSASVFSWAKDFCASDCAKVKVESDIRTTDSIKRSDFMFILVHSSFCSNQSCLSHTASLCTHQIEHFMYLSDSSRCPLKGYGVTN